MKGPSTPVALLADAPRIPHLRVPRGLSPTDVGALVGVLVREATAVRLGMATAAILVGGTLLAIMTTPDPLWWHLHFSRLGTFPVFSGYAFNSALMATGAGVALFGLRLRAEMTVHAGTPVLTSRRSATVVPILVVVTGIHLSFVGIIPQNSNEFLHDRASTGAVLTFFVILLISRWMLRGMHRSIRRVTRRVAVGWAISVSLFVPGIINMALFELIGFALIFGWLLFFARLLGRPDEAPARVTSRTASMQRTVVVAPPIGAERVAVTGRELHRAHTGLRAATHPAGTGSVRRAAGRTDVPQRLDPAHHRSRGGRTEVDRT